MKLLLSILVLVITVKIGSAQLVTGITSSPTALVNNVLLGQGVVATNITYNGEFQAIGTFNGTNTNIGLASGIIINTGTVENTQTFGIPEGPHGPNNEGGAGLDNNAGGDPLLSSIANIATEDAAVLEFDFVASGSNISFRYVFGSEEYPEFVNAGFNDAFGFLCQVLILPEVTSLTRI